MWRGKILELLEKSKYREFDDFCSGHPNGFFQQSPAWAPVKKDWKSEILVKRDEGGKIRAGIMILIRKLGTKALMYAARGPVCDYKDAETLKEIYESVKQLGEENNAYAFIMDPLVEAKDRETINNFKSAGFEIKENAPFHDTIQPRYNFMLEWPEDIDEAGLMASANRKTRYYMNYAGKHGVICTQPDRAGLDDFYTLYEMTGQRKDFNIRAKDYFERIMNSFGNKCRLYMCYYEDIPLCGGLIIMYGGVTSWVYGASSNELRNLNASEFLQKNMMLRAIENGCRIYDMQGVSVNPEDDEELYGVYLFKSKFPGRVVEAAGEFTITFDRLYKKAIDSAIKIRKKLLK